MPVAIGLAMAAGYTFARHLSVQLLAEQVADPVHTQACTAMCSCPEALGAVEIASTSPGAHDPHSRNHSPACSAHTVDMSSLYCFWKLRSPGKGVFRSQVASATAQQAVRTTMHVAALIWPLQGASTHLNGWSHQTTEQHIGLPSIVTYTRPSPPR